MSPAYIDGRDDPFTRAPRLVFDRFHVIKLYNDKLSDLRRELYRTANSRTGLDKEVHSKGSTLVAAEAAGDTGCQPATSPQRLQEALRLNEPLAMAYYLKEELNEIWEQDDERGG